MSNEFRFLLYKSTNEDVSVNAVIKDETMADTKSDGKIIRR